MTRDCRKWTPIILALAAPAGMATGPSALRQTTVHQKSTTVMPFSLDKTQHIFQATDWGGIEIVVVRDPTDEYQLRLIREHLKHETQRFGAGDFSDPAAIHGKNMPGLARLAASAKNIAIDYTSIPHGAAIAYRASTPELISSLHDWLKAQSMDHGHDGMSN